MARTGIEVRRDRTAAMLRKLARQEKKGRVAARLFGIANILDGMDRETAARSAGMTRQTLRDWVHRYNTEGVDGLGDRPKGHPPRSLTPAQEQAIAELVEQPPANQVLGRWRCADVKAEIERRYGVVLHESSVGTLLRRLGFRRMSVRPEHPQGDAQAQEAFKTTFAERVAEILPVRAIGKSLEFWFQDEARVGQKGTLTRIWARRGMRPCMPRDQRHDSAYIFGAVCPARDQGVALVLPEVNCEAMNLHLAEIAQAVPSSTHAVVIIDGAGWHQEGGTLVVPHNLSLLRLPPYSPQLNAQENIWQYLRQNFLAGRIFDTYDAIVDACCNAWKALITETGRIKSIASRDWLQWKTS